MRFLFDGYTSLAQCLWECIQSGCTKVAVLNANLGSAWGDIDAAQVNQRAICQIKRRTRKAEVGSPGFLESQHFSLKRSDGGNVSRSNVDVIEVDGRHHAPKAKSQIDNL